MWDWTEMPQLPDWCVGCKYAGESHYWCETCNKGSDWVPYQYHEEEDEDV